MLFYRSRKFLLVLSLFALSFLMVGITFASSSITFSDTAVNGNNGLVYERVPSASDAPFTQLKLDALDSDNDGFADVAPIDFSTATIPVKSRGAPGIAILDYDNDGDLDLYVTNGPGADNSLFDNQLAQTGQTTFVDVAAAAGVAVTAQDSTGVCYGDIDNDGDHDLLVLGNREANQLFENSGDGTFTDITAASNINEFAPSPGSFGVGGSNSMSCSMGDINGDGYLDVAIANLFDMNSALPLVAVPFSLNEHNDLFVNNGDNSFTNVSNSSGFRDQAGLDSDGDGNFDPNLPTPTWAIAMVDYDLDGDMDILTANDQGAFPPASAGGFDRGLLHVFQNDGTGQFTDVIVDKNMAYSGAWMAFGFGDVNCDGFMDVFGTNFGDYNDALMGSGTVSVGAEASRWLLGQPDGFLADPGVGALLTTPFGWGTAVSDLDNDADQDIVFHGGMDLARFLDLTNPGTILENDGCTANFSHNDTALAGSTDHTRRIVEGVAVGDLNADGFVDIVSVSSSDWLSSLPVFPIPAAIGSPFDDDVFWQAQFYPSAQPGTFLFSGQELDNGTLSVEMNSADNGNNWVAIDVVGSIDLTDGAQVNRDGIGAVVYFTPKHGNTTMHPVLGGSSYASQHSLTAHFGLGSDNKGTVEVLWPGGVRNRLYNVKKGANVTFPEIPCSFDADWGSFQAYRDCVKDALDDLQDADVITSGERGKLLSSAIRAYHDAH